MAKKIAVLVRDRQEEALRMAVGLILMDDTVDVYVLDKKIADTENNALNVETMKEMDIQVYTNCPDNEGFPVLSTGELAERLLGYDHILPY